MKTIITSYGGVKAYQAPSCEQIDLICSSSMLPLAAFSPFHILLLQNTQAGGDNSSASREQYLI